MCMHIYTGEPDWTTRACSICGVGQMLKEVGFAFVWKIEKLALTIMTTSYSSGTVNSLQLP